MTTIASSSGGTQQARSSCLFRVDVADSAGASLDRGTLAVVFDASAGGRLFRLCLSLNEQFVASDRRRVPLAINDDNLNVKDAERLLEAACELVSTSVAKSRARTIGHRPPRDQLTSNPMRV
jgi:hypothetical protein